MNHWNPSQYQLEILHISPVSTWSVIAIWDTWCSLDRVCRHADEKSVMWTGLYVLVYWFIFFVQNDAQCSETNEKSIFWLLRFCSLWVMFDFVHNFQVFLSTENGKKCLKDAQCSKRIFELVSMDVSQIRIRRSPPHLRSGHIYMKDAHSTESNEKSFHRKLNSQKRCAMGWNEWNVNFQIFPIFIFWDMIEFVLKFRKKIMYGGCAPPNLVFFSLFFSFVFFNKNSTWSLLRGECGGICMSLIGTGPNRTKSL